MPTPATGKRTSRAGPTSTGPYKSSSERADKAKSNQLSRAYDGTRRGSEQPRSGLEIVSERPGLKGRTNSAPLVDSRIARVGGWEHLEDGEPTDDVADSAPAPSVGNENAQDEDEVAGVVGAMRHFEPFQSPELSEPLPDINIAVIGAQGVGKSTFVQKALGLPFPSELQAVEHKIAFDGIDYIVRFLELQLDNVFDDEYKSIDWPETIEDRMMPRIDGVLALYDIRNRTTLRRIPDMLSDVYSSGLTSFLVSTNCDAKPDERQLDPDFVERKTKDGLGRLNTLQFSANATESHKKGLSMILRAIISRTDDKVRSLSANRRRAQSNAVRTVSPRPPSDRGHLRAASEYSGGLQKEKRHSRHDSSQAGHGSHDRLKVPNDMSEEDMHRSFLFEESPSETSGASNRSSAEEVTPAPTGADTSLTSENGATFDELVDRLIAQPSSKADTKFQAIFLALYRKFAAPGRLLEAIVDRFDALSRNRDVQLTRTTTQLRYMYILQQWVGTYPGDFAYPKTKRRMRTFVSKISQQRIFAAAAKEMNADLDAVKEDDDTNWEYSDKDRVNSTSDVRASLSTTASMLLDDPAFTITEDLTLTDPSQSTSEVDTAHSMSSSQINVNVEAAQKQAALLHPIPRQHITKVQWRQLMESSDDVLARELTRMDWIMFCSIQPRDLVRQVSLSKEKKAGCKNLSHVNRMIDHFNQLAFWVENYILLRDKPKHRALMLEKFMRIARKLRELNNYNALGAIIAGIKSSAVHRLAATRDLISPNIGKDWMKLEVLMAPARSYSAYRLAWENSSSERIPYLPLHRRDLVSAEEGNKTFIGDEADGIVNWKKFEIIGEVIVSMQKAQGMPYKGFLGSRGNEQIKELVLDVKLVKDEDDLFGRSKQVEPSGAVGGGTSARLKEFFKRPQ